MPGCFRSRSGHRAWRSDTGITGSPLSPVKDRKFSHRCREKWMAYFGSVNGASRHNDSCLRLQGRDAMSFRSKRRSISTASSPGSGWFSRQRSQLSNASSCLACGTGSSASEVSSPRPDGPDSAMLSGREGTRAPTMSSKPRELRSHACSLRTGASSKHARWGERAIRKRVTSLDIRPHRA
jgi:hypothetical protein